MNRSVVDSSIIVEIFFFFSLILRMLVGKDEIRRIKYHLIRIINEYIFQTVSLRIQEFRI